MFKTIIPLTAEASRKEGEESSVKSSVKILELIKEDQSITIPELAEIIWLSTRAIEKQIARLKETGKLERIGPDKGGYWKLME